MAQILVVDDLSAMRSALTECLAFQGLNVDQAEDGKTAIASLTSRRYDLVISDVMMPHVDGLELLKWIRTNTPEVKVILITGFSQILETQQAIELGADDFLPKPIRLNELMDAISRHISQAISRGRQNIEQDYCRIGLEELLSCSNFRTPLYIRVSTTSFIRIAEEGDSISSEKIAFYRKKGLETLYCKVTDYDTWQK